MFTLFHIVYFQGATVRNEGGGVFIGRIVKGGAAEKSGMSPHFRLKCSMWFLVLMDFSFAIEEITSLFVSHRDMNVGVASPDFNLI
jgi:hypothetical protein